MTDYTPYQKGIIKRFYDNRDTIALQKLGEIVSNLYLETSEAKRKRLWKSARAKLIAAGVHEKDADHVIREEDLGAVAEFIAKLT